MKEETVAIQKDEIAAEKGESQGFGIWSSEEEMIERAKVASDKEHEMSITDCFRNYWKAIAWTVVICLSTTMESYDMQLISSLFGYPSFQQKYGKQLPDGSYGVPANWQMALTAGSVIGIFIGIMCNGYLIDWCGHKKPLIISHLLMTAFIFVPFFAHNVQVLFVGEILCGLPWGIFNTIAPLYAVECCPTKLRAYMATYVNLNWVIGHFICAGVLQGLVNNTTEWSYRIPFAIQWVWPLPLAVVICFAPNSPWWLVKKDKLDDATRAVKRLTAANTTVDSSDLVAMINHTYLVEKEMEVGASYTACFQGDDLRRTEIATVVWASQPLVGFVVQNYNSYFFKLAGLDPSQAYSIALGSFAIAFVGTCSSWILLTYLGRRTVYLAGLAGMIPVLFCIGFLSFGASYNDAIPWAQSVLLLIWFAIYGLTIGPVPFILCSEISSSKLRTKTISISRGACYIMFVLSTICGPYMLNPGNGNLKGKTAFPASGCCIVLLIWAFFRLPESKNRTFAELDVLFARKVPARNFKTIELNFLDEVDVNKHKDSTL